jgi:hypothetical protein
VGEPTRLDHLAYMATDDPSQLQPLSLAQSLLVAVLDRRELGPLAIRLAELVQRQLPPRADNRLRHVAGLRLSADLLGEVSLPVLEFEDLVAAVEQVRGTPSLGESIADLALAYALRVHGREMTTRLWPYRAEAPVGEECEVLTLLAMSLDDSKSPDSWSDRETGWMTAHAALDMAGTARVATWLALVARHPGATAASLREIMRVPALAWAQAMVGIEASEPEWAIGQDGRLTLAVQVSGTPGEIQAALPCVLHEVAYRLPWHLLRLKSGALRTADVKGARRAADVARAAGKGVDLVLRSSLAGLTAADLDALTMRQEAGLRWLREREAIETPPLRNERIS